MEKKYPIGDDIEKKIYEILLNHTYADRTKAAGEIAQMFKGMPPLEEPILSDEDMKAWEKEQKTLTPFEETILEKTFQRSLKDKPGSFYQSLFDHMHQEHGLTLLESQMADIIHLVEKMQTTDKSQFIREYKQYKENLKYLGGQGEWTLDKVSRMNNIEVWETIKGFNELIAFLDTVLYAYEEGAHDWEERCLKAESAPAKESDAVVLTFIRDVADNWDCDEDGHKYNTGCRKCNAAELLYELTRKQKEAKP